MAILWHVLSAMLLGIPAMILHECGHIAMAVVCRVKVKKVGFSRRGLYTIREAGPKWANFLVSLAGPLFNLFLAFALWDSMRMFAEINVVACLYNLLPIPHSDGTRILALLANTNAAVPQAMPEMQPRV